MKTENISTSPTLRTSPLATIFNMLHRHTMIYAFKRTNIIWGGHDRLTLTNTCLPRMFMMLFGANESEKLYRRRFVKFSGDGVKSSFI
eukprot:scaffold48131_cov22-Cyclotella_meneghiniana.AAC.1